MRQALYGADERLRYHQEQAPTTSGSTVREQGTREEYRYDPPGRRVLVRSSRDDASGQDVLRNFGEVAGTSPAGLAGGLDRRTRELVGAADPSASGSAAAALAEAHAADFTGRKTARTAPPPGRSRPAASETLEVAGPVL
ncbi:MAG TPA: hypothetical protein VHG08_01800 [Longimicrobium sp.]|nr:hypothetical protein [Longimicrobium sp.]